MRVKRNQGKKEFKIQTFKAAETLKFNFKGKIDRRIALYYESEILFEEKVKLGFSRDI